LKPIAPEAGEQLSQYDYRKSLYNLLQQSEQATERDLVDIFVFLDLERLF
jgi:hypothetical protein